ncbi:MAG: hypothetical protein GX414_04140 [Acidobacteria bacterium]|nr:hypothetical protein [Acidobacteriota bacterium]
MAAYARRTTLVFVGLVACAVFIAGQGDPAEIVQRAIQTDRQLAGWTPKDPHVGVTPAMSFTRGYTYASQALARYGGTNIPHVYIDLKKFNAADEAEKEYDQKVRNIQQQRLEIIHENFGVGSRSTLHKHFEIIRRDGTPKGRPAYEVNAVGGGWLLRVSVYNRLDESVVDDGTAGRTARSVAETIFGLIQPAASPDPPRIHSARVRLQHLSRTRAALPVIAYIRYPQAMGNPRPGDVLVAVRLGDQVVDSEPGDASFVVSEREIRVERVLTTEQTGPITLRVDLLDRRFHMPSNRALAYEDRFRIEVDVPKPAAEIKGVSGKVFVIRKQDVARKDGDLFVRDSTAPAADRSADAEAIHSAWLYDGDRVVLADTGQRVTRTAGGDTRWPILSSVDLEWEGGVRGRAFYRPGLYTVGGGQFTVGATRGLSGEITNRWGRTLRDYGILFTQVPNETFDGSSRDAFNKVHKYPNPVEWVLRRIPGVGPAMANAKKYGVFSWHAGDTVLSDIQYLELESEVYVQPEADARLKFFVLEGKPVLHAGRGDARMDLRSGQVATCAPAQPAVTAAFDPAQLERVWENIRYVSWDNADREEPQRVADATDTADDSGTADASDAAGIFGADRPMEPVDLDQAARILQGLERPPSGPAAGIPSLQATVTNVKFHESGIDAAPPEQRIHATRFPRSTTRLVWWEINLAYPDPGRRIDFSVESLLYRPDGSLLNRQVQNYFIQSPWTSSSHYAGCGGLEPGTWAPGVYRVELHVAGQKVAEGSFEIF